MTVDRFLVVYPGATFKTAKDLPRKPEAHAKR